MDKIYYDSKTGYIGFNKFYLKVKSKFPEINLVRYSQNCGASSSKNTGISMATGNWITFLDSDCLWLAEKLENQKEFIEKFPFYRILQSHEQKHQGWIFEKGLEISSLTLSGLAIEKSLFDEIGNFDESMPACEEYELALRISSRFPVGLDSKFAIEKFVGEDEEDGSQEFLVKEICRVYALLKFYVSTRDMKLKPHVKEMAIKKLKTLCDWAKKRDLSDTLYNFEQILDAIVNETHWKLLIGIEFLVHMMKLDINKTA